MTITECGKSVSWWDGEYEGKCQRPQGHNGDHFDGLSWYDDYGDETKQPGDWYPWSDNDA